MTQTKTIIDFSKALPISARSLAGSRELRQRYIDYYKAFFTACARAWKNESDRPQIESLIERVASAIPGQYAEQRDKARRAAQEGPELRKPSETTQLPYRYILLSLSESLTLADAQLFERYGLDISLPEKENVGFVFDEKDIPEEIQGIALDPHDSKHCKAVFGSAAFKNWVAATTNENMNQIDTIIGILTFKDTSRFDFNPHKGDMHRDGVDRHANTSGQLKRSLLGNPFRRAIGDLPAKAHASKTDLNAMAFLAFAKAAGLPLKTKTAPAAVEPAMSS